jgi:DNA-binding MarR family transcriptional regulator/GNAT superfamily N-acetyltransferase
MALDDLTRETTAVLRRFNRSYTQRIGALDDSFLGTGLPLGTARLLYELGSRPGTVQDLRVRLGLDSGYLSRMLRRLEEEGLADTAVDETDRRRRLVRLTAKGRRRWASLEQRSQEKAATLVEALTPRHRERLARALAEAELLVRAATVSLDDVEPTAPLAVRAVGSYFAELDRRFPDGFDATGLATTDADQLRAPHGVFVVATSDGEPVACGGVQTIGPGIGEIKRMWVHESWRGAGLGTRLLRHLEQRARDLGHRLVRLDTNQTLAEAITLYERAGYQQIARYNDNPKATHFFEKPL